MIVSLQVLFIFRIHFASELLGGPQTETFFAVLLCQFQRLPRTYIVYVYKFGPNWFFIISAIFKLWKTKHKKNL